MEEFDDTVHEATISLKSFATNMQRYEDNPNSSASRASLAAAQPFLRKARNSMMTARSQLAKLNAMEKKAANDILTGLDDSITKAQDRMNRATQQAETSGAAPREVTVNDRAREVAKKALTNNAYLKDANRGAAEAAEIGSAIVDKLGSQNAQMEGINRVTLNIQAGADTGAGIAKQMLKTERKITIVLWVLAAGFIASCGVAGWLFHHDVPTPPAPTK